MGAAIYGALVAILCTGLTLLPLFGDILSLRAIFWGVVGISIGIGFVAGVRRHTLVFRCGDRTLHWISSKREFRRLHTQIRELHGLACSLGIVVQDFQE
jgi:hypothetical protein